VGFYKDFTFLDVKDYGIWPHHILQTKDMYDNAKRRFGWNVSFSKKLLSFLENFVPSGIFLTSCHLLILDGHGSHVIQKK
jgi:hypothetical protein